MRWGVHGLVLLCVVAIALLVDSSHAADTPLEAGFAVVNITPTDPTPLGGYAARRGAPFASVHDAIDARAVVLRRGDASVAIVSLDTVGVSRALRTEVSRRVRDLGLTDVVLAATHNHAGPGALTRVPVWKPAMGPFDPLLFDWMVGRVVEAIRSAHADLGPVRVRGGRSAPDACAGLLRNRETDGGAVDGSVGVLRLDGPDGTPRGVIVHFAAHPTILPASVRQVSAGWPGALRSAMEEAIPGATVIYLNGAMGDVAPVVPADTGDDPFVRAAAFGEAVARPALALHGRLAAANDAGSDRLEVHGTHPTWAWTAGEALLTDPEQRHGASALAPTDPWPLPVSGIVAGGIVLATVPGEPVHDVGRILGQGPTRWIVSCAQDHLGYFADRELFQRGNESYAVDLSFFGPGVADVLGLGHEAIAAGLPPLPPVAASRGTVDPGPWRVRSQVVTCCPNRDLGGAHGTVLGGAVRDLLIEAEAYVRKDLLERGAGLAFLPAAVQTGVPVGDLIVPALLRSARRLQAHVPPEFLDEMEGIADAAGVPYDAILFENTFLTLAEQPEPARLFSLPVRCTNVVALGEATSMGQVLHASSLDWGMGEVLKERTVILAVEPRHGHPFLSVTWPGMVGVLRAMSAQGIAITEESCAAKSDSTLDGLPVNLLMRHVVQYAANLDEAVQWIEEAPGTCGYKITVSDGRALDARVVAVTANHHHTRTPTDGLVFGCDPDAGLAAYVGGARDPAIPLCDGSSVRRYPAVQAHLAPLRNRIRRSDLADALALRRGGVLSNETLLDVIFEPQIGRMHVGLRDGVDAEAGRIEWTTYDLAEHVTPEARRRASPPWSVAVTGAVETKAGLALPGIRKEIVWFASPVRSGHDANDRVRAEFYTPEDPRGVVIQLPPWKESNLVGQRLLALMLARQGLAALILPLPYQHDRAVEGHGSGEWTLSHDLARTREAFFQGAADVVRAGLWLELERGFEPERQGVLGVSLGGHVAALVAGAYPDRFTAGAFLLAGAGIENAFLEENGVTGGVRRRLEQRGVTPQEAAALIGPIDPGRYGRPRGRERVLLVAGDADRVVPPARVRALAAAWGGARIVWFEGGHYGIVTRLGTALREVSAHFLSAFGDP